MKLTPALLLLLLLPAAPAGAAAQDRPSLGVRVTACETGLTAAERAGEFTASMPAMGRGHGLAVRFTLQERDGTTWRRVRVPAWARWQKAAPGASGLVYAKRIERLDAPATYRARVAFRWTDADGRVVRRATRTSATCRQPDLRPDLRPARLTVAPEGQGTARYTLVVENTGLGHARSPFAVALSVAGAAQPRQELPDLAADGTATLSWLAPACPPGERVVVEVDPSGAVDEADEDDGVLTRRC